MNSSIAPVRGTIKKCLLEYVSTQQAQGDLPPGISERKINNLIEPMTDRLLTRVVERMDYYLPIILRDELEDHIKDVISKLH